MPVTSKTPYFHSLDWLRGFAALQVLGFHVIHETELNNFTSDNPLFSLIRKGWMGVDLFFVLCGCVITYSLFHLRKNHSTHYWKIFLWRRAARILPLYFLTIILWLILFGFPEGINITEKAVIILRYLTLTHSFLSTHYGLINGVNWSIGIEIQFYIMAVILSGFLMRCRYFTIFLSTIGIAWVYKIIIYSQMSDYPKEILENIPYFCQLLPMLDAFGIGMITGKFLAQDATKTIPRLRPYIYSILCGSLLLLSVLWTLWWKQDNAIAYPFFHLPMRTLLHVCFGLVILSFVCMETIHKGFSNRYTRPVGYIGTISYGIYLWHLFVIKLLGMHYHLNGWETLIATLLLTFICASTSWHFFEKPIISFFRTREASLYKAKKNV